MKKKSLCKLRKTEIVGAVFGVIFGTSLHFLYDLTGHSVFVAAFSAVNESTWEHLKLFIVPVVIFMIFERRTVGDDRRLLAAKLCQLLFGILFIEGGFYLYTGALGFENVIVDIGLFVAAMVGGYWLSWRWLSEDNRLSRPARSPRLHWLTRSARPREDAHVYGLAIALIVAFVFVATFCPPHLPIFRDSTTGLYGLGG